MTSLLMVAGEASGDLHGARLLAELRQRHLGLAPFGLGGQELAQEGLERLANSAEISVVGITEVLRILSRAREIFRLLLAEVDRRGTRLAILIDFPEFNLRLARELKRRGVTVVYYISPQVWAWRKGRVKTIARVVDRMLVLFPFEEEFYRRAGVQATCVGHPLVDEVPVLPQAWDGAGQAPTRFRIALLPGSRRSEVQALLPAMAASVHELAARLPITVQLVQAPTVPRELLASLIAPFGQEIEIVDRDRFAVLAHAHLALCASGTATLELGLLTTPMLVLYRLGFWTFTLARVLVDLPHISLVNLVLEREAVPELLQGEVRPARVAAAAEDLLRDPSRVGRMRRDLAELRGRLGESGAAGRAAALVAEGLARLAPSGEATPGAVAEVSG